MLPTLYMIYSSPPSRAILITAKAIGLNLNKKLVDVVKGEQFNPEYLKINPQHTVPTFVDSDGFIIWDSHAIMAYLVSKYTKDDSLYPQDLKTRALVNQRLFFESGVLFPFFRNIIVNMLYNGKSSINEKEKKEANDCYQFLETFLDGREWIAGDSVTIADYCLITSVTSLNVFISVDEQRFPKLAAWFKKCQDLSECEENRRGLKEIVMMFGNLVET